MYYKNQTDNAKLTAAIAEIKRIRVAMIAWKRAFWQIYSSARRW